MWQLHHREPWLIVQLDRPMQTLGWTPQGGGLVRAETVLWRAVRNADLTEDLDVTAWLQRETAARAAPGSPCFLTSARLADHAEAAARVEGIEARALATAGLGNAERIGQRQRSGARVGTINLLLAVSEPLTLPAALEALSLMAEARTTAMLDHAPRLWPEPPTGTGTDCLCLAWPPGAPGAEFAGKHTALGEAVGRAAHAALMTAIQRWSPPQ